MLDMSRHFVPNVRRATERSLRVMQAAIISMNIGYPVVTFMENEEKDTVPLEDEEAKLEDLTMEKIKGEDRLAQNHLMRESTV